MTPGLGKSNGRQESIPLTPGARSRFDTKKSSNGRLERVEFRRRISAILDVVGAFLRGVGSKKLADGGKDRVVGAGGGFSEPMLELGEDLLDRVQVRRIFRQEEKLRSGLSDGAAHSLAAMTAEIVHEQQEATTGHLAAIVAVSADAIVSVALDGKFMSWNPGAEEMFGFSAAEAVGSPSFELIVPPSHRAE